MNDDDNILQVYKHEYYIFNLHERFIFFCICLKRDVLFLISTILHYLQVNFPYLKRKIQCKNGCDTDSEYKISIFNLQIFSHFCMDFYVTKMSRSAVKSPF